MYATASILVTGCAGTLLLSAALLRDNPARSWVDGALYVVSLTALLGQSYQSIARRGSPQR